MAASEPLDPQGGTVRVGNLELRTPGLAGIATALPTSPNGLRAEGLSAPRLERLLRDNDLQTQAVLKIERSQVVRQPARVAMRTTRHKLGAIELRVPAPQKGWGQMVLSKDENDIVSWHFAVDAFNNPVTRGPGARTYLVPQQRFGAAERAKSRGFLGWAGKKILRVVAFDLAGKLVGKAAEIFAGRWELEDKHRPYAVRGFTPADYTKAAPPGVTLDWLTVTEKKAGEKGLLIVHGTLTRSHTEFSKVSLGFVKELHRLYGGRVFAFDHPTLSRSPAENIDEFVNYLPRNASLDLDVICISRGGLVTRELETRIPDLSTGSRQVRIHRVVFIAAPNNGTILADGKHWNDFIDIYTSALNLIPDNPVTDILDAVITVAKLIAVGALRGLTGIQAMRPNGPYLNALNASTIGAGNYFAVASNFEPGGTSGWTDYVRNVVIDKVFHGEGNDLIVPSEGVFEANGSQFFPIPQLLVFAPRDHVSHSGYLRNNKVQTRILQWLA